MSNEVLTWSNKFPRSKGEIEFYNSQPIDNEGSEYLIVKYPETVNACDVNFAIFNEDLEEGGAHFSVGDRGYITLEDAQAAAQHH